MRTFLIVLTILLLPLRGWMGDAMAIERVGGMAGQQAHAAAHANASASAAEHAAHDHAAHDHAAHDAADTAHGAAHGAHDEAHAAPVAPAAADSIGNAAAHAGDECAGSCCTSCPVCHSMAITALPVLPASVRALAAAPVFRSAGFASAERAPGFKPPIS